MEAGRLRDRIAIQKATLAQDSYGSPVPTWTEVCEVWGCIRQLSGRESYTVQQYEATVTGVIEIRHRTGITPKMRATHGGRTFEIHAVMEDERRTMLSLMVEEVQA